MSVGRPLGIETHTLCDVVRDGDRVRPKHRIRNRTTDATMGSTRETMDVLPIVGIRPLSGRTGTTLLMSLLGTSPSIAFDRRYPAEYRIGSYLARMGSQMTEPFDERTHVGVTDFFFGPQPSWGPLPFPSDALDIESWRPELLRAMWASASEEMLAARPDARWYAEKLATDEGLLRAAGIEVFTIDLVRDPRDILASRRSFLAGGTDHWARDAKSVADELSERLDELDAQAPDLRLRYEDLALDLEAAAETLSEHLEVELFPSNVDRPAQHVTTPSATASVGRWRSDLDDDDAATLTPIAERLGY